MAVVDGQTANATTFNDALVSRTQDTNTTGKLDLENTDGVSGASVLNTQKAINGGASFVGSDPNGVENQSPTWASDTIGTPNEDVQARVESVQAQVETHITDKVDKVAATDNVAARFDGGLGAIQPSGVTIDDGDNVVIPGNLTVNGTTTTINTTNLDVTDTNITVNDGGNDASSEGAGLTVERTGTGASLVFDSTLNSLWKAGLVGTEVPLVTDSAAAVLINKDYDGGTAAVTSRFTLSKDTTTNLNALARKEGTMYGNTTTKKPVYDDGITLIEIGSGSGSGGGAKSFITGDSSTFESSEGDWVLFDDGSVSEPVDGITGNNALTKGLDAVNILADTQSFFISKSTVDAQGEGVSLDFEIDPVQQGRELDVSFFFATDAGYVADDVRCWMYDVTNATLINILTLGGDGSIPLSPLANNGSIFQGRFVSASDSVDYRLIFMVQNSNTNGLTLLLDDIKVTAKSFFNAPLITSPVSFTPIWNNVTVGNATQVFEQWQEGDRLHIQGVFIFGSTSAFTSTISFDNPLPGTTLSILSGSFWHDGTVNLYDSSTSANREIGNIFLSGNAIFPLTVASAAVNATGPFTWATGDTLSFNLSFKINELSNGALLSTTQISSETVKIESTVSTASHTNNNNFQDIAWTEVTDPFDSFDGTVFTAPKDGLYYVSASITFAGNATGSRTVRAINSGETAEVARSSTLDSIPGGILATTNLGNLVTLAQGDTVKIQGFQNSGGNLGYISTVGQSNFSVFRLPDFTSVGVFSELENIQSSTTTDTSWAITAGQWGDLESIVLSAGVYDLTAFISFRNSGAISAVNHYIGIHNVAGNNAPGGGDEQRTFGDTTSGGTESLNMFKHQITITAASETWYLKGRIDTAITNKDYRSKISARRVG